MVGATGRYGRLVLKALLEQQVWVRALVLSPQRAAVARRCGAHEAVVADLTRPGTLGPALADMDGVFHIGPGLHPHEAAMGTALVAAARAARVGKFVFSGVIHPSISALSNHAAKLPVEDAIYRSGMDFAVLQPARFMQTLHDYWAADRGELAMPYSVTSPMSWVDYRDVADVAALAMTGDLLSGGTFELSAPGNCDGVQMAALLTEMTGRRVTAVRTPATEFARRLPQPHRRAFMHMMAYYDQTGLPAGNGRVLAHLLGRDARTVPGFLQELTSQAQHRTNDIDHQPNRR
jgi:uncharacterized protein YbjT (DUF2867 family)